jgi:hypothetical protein
MVKKGQEQVSRMDSPRQGEDRNPAQSEGSSKGS